MAQKLKITKKMLKEPDEFISLSQRAFFFIDHHLKQIAIGGSIVLVLGVAIFLFYMWKNKQQDDANRRFALAVGAYQKTSSLFREAGSADNDKETLEKFDEVAAKFPGTSSGRLALLYVGNIHLKSGDYEKAIKAYESFLEREGKEKMYRAFALEGLGYAYEGKKDFEKALAAYQKVTAMGEGFDRTSAYFSMGRCNEKLGKNKEALENYRTYLKLSPKSQMANAALRKISILEK
jgi:tetratricopeptide (TPR) repeat protein